MTNTAIDTSGASFRAELDRTLDTLTSKRPGAVSIREYAERIVATAPPLTDEQKQTLTAVFSQASAASKRDAETVGTGARDAA